MICPECSSEVPDVTDVCGKCGFEFTGKPKPGKAGIPAAGADEKNSPAYKQLYHEAVHAYEKGGFAECLQLCDQGIGQFSDTSDFKRVRHYAVQKLEEEGVDISETASSADASSAAQPADAKSAIPQSERLGKDSPEYAQKYQNAVRAFENGAYEKCVEVCDRAMDRFKDIGDFQSMRYQASLKATEIEYSDHVINKHQETVVAYEGQKQLENDAIVAFEIGDFEKCIGLCEQGLANSDGASDLKALKHQASLKLMESEYHKRDSAEIADRNEARIRQLRELEDAAAAAFEAQDYDLCVEKCDQVSELRMESPRCNELKSWVASRLEELEEQLSRSEFFFEQENWEKAVESSMRVLEIKSDNSEAKYMLEVVRNKIKKKRRDQVVFGGVVMAILGVLVIAVGVWIKFYHGKNPDTEKLYRQYYGSAQQFLSKANDLTSVNGLAALKFLVEANEQLAYAREEKVLAEVTPDQRSKFELLDADINGLLTSIELAHELYESKIPLIKQARADAERHSKREPAKAAETYMKALGQLEELRAAGVIEFLEIPRQQEIKRLHSEIEKTFKAFIFASAVKMRAKAKKMGLHQSESFIQGNLMLSKAEDVFKDGEYDRSVELLTRSESGFDAAVSVAYRTIQLHHYRDSYLERLEAVDMDKLARVAPEKSNQIRNLQISAAESLIREDYVATIQYYAAAVKLLEQAEDDLKGE